MVTREGASDDFLALYTAPSGRLAGVMRSGTKPDAEYLAGREFRGANTPRVAALLGIRRFIKGFKSEPDRSFGGYNVRVPGRDLHATWTTRTWFGGPREFGFFTVTPVNPERIDNRYLDALLLDYGVRSRGLNPTRYLKDYLVKVNPDSDELLLGEAFLAVLGRRIPLGYFVLEPMPR